MTFDPILAYKYAKALWDVYGSTSPGTARPYPGDTVNVSLKKALLILNSATA